MDGALLATNAAQLRQLLTEGFLNTKDPKWFISIILVVTSIILQLLTIFILAYLANNNLGDRLKRRYINTMNNVVLLMSGIIFVINIISNVFIQIDFTSILSKTTSGFSMFWPETTTPNIFS